MSQRVKAIERQLSGSWPLVGRRRELQALRTLVAGPGGGVLLTGGAGVGKSTLAESALAECKAVEALVVATHARAERHEQPGAIARLLLDAVDPAVKAPRAGLTSAVLRQLRAKADGRRIVVGIDDVDHLDGTSVGLVQHVVATLGATLVLTCRSEGVDSNAAAPLLHRGLVHRMEIGGLSQLETEQLLDAVLGGPVDGVSRDRLWRMSQGNPLALRHLLMNGVKTGTLDRVAGLWSWADEPDGVVASLLPMIRDDLGELSDSQAQALSVVALAEPLPLDLAECAADPVALEELEQRRLIVVRGTGAAPTVVTAHPLYGELARADIAPADLAATLTRLAEVASTLRVHGQRVCGAVQVARWRLASGQRIPSSEAVAAARLALCDGDAALAETLALQAWPPHGGPELARALIAQGNASEAEALLDSLTDAEDRMDLAPLRAVNLLWGLGDAESAREVVEAAPMSPGIALADLALRLFERDPRPTPADQTAELGADVQGDPLLRGCAQVLAAYRLTFGGRPGRLVLDVADGSVSPLDGWASMRGATEICHVHALGLVGRLEEARSTVRHCYDDAIRRRDGAAIGALAFESAVVAMWEGDYPTARLHLAESRRHLDWHAPVPLKAYLASERAVCEAALGHPRRAADTLRRAREAFPADSGLRDHLAWGEIRVDLYAGQPDAPARLAELAARQVREGRRSQAAESLLLLARIGHGAGLAGQLREIVNECDSPLFDLYATLAEALVVGDPRTLGLVADRLERWGYFPLALEAAAAARVLTVDSRERLATELARQTTRLTLRCRGIRPPWQPRVPRPTRLTSRELEVCRHAARGLDNSTIAGRLGISVRTVANHLQRSYDKLGVSGRDDLAAGLSPVDAAAPLRLCAPARCE